MEDTDSMQRSGSLPVEMEESKESEDERKRDKLKGVPLQRFIVEIKSKLLAVPFDPTENLDSLRGEVCGRIKRHKKLKKKNKLSGRLRFIKLKVPHYPMLIEVWCFSLSAMSVSNVGLEYIQCDAQDAVGEIVTAKDIIVLHTVSDDETADKCYSLEGVYD